MYESFVNKSTPACVSKCGLANWGRGTRLADLGNMKHRVQQQSQMYRNKVLECNSQEDSDDTS